MSRQLVPKLALLAATLVLLFGVGELAARFVLDTPPANLEDSSGRDGGQMPSVGPNAVPTDPDLPRFRNSLDIARKDLEGIYKGVYFRTNSQSFRGPEWPLQAPPGVFRIGITGDSVAMGEGVLEEERYSDLLETRLNQGLAAPRFQVLNFAISGANIDHAMRRLHKGMLAYAPDLIVYGFTVNDIEGPSYIERDRGELEAYRRAQRMPLARSPSHLLRFVAWRWYALFQPWDPKDSWYAAEVRANYFENPPAREAFLESLDLFARKARYNGLCGVVFVHTHLTHTGPDHPFLDIYDFVAKESEARGLYAIQSFEAFADRPWRPLWIYVFDPHPNAEGHVLLADELEKGLRALPPECWKGHPPGP